MIRRYRHTGAVIFIKTRVASNTAGSSTSTSQTYTTAITGEPGALVTFKVTSYTASGGATPTYTVDAVTYVLNDTFTRTLDGSGNASFIQIVDVGTIVPGNGLDVILTIMSTSIGTVDGAANTTNCSKTV